jgi:hypothetical protein
MPLGCILAHTDSLRALAFGGIGAAYNPVGAAFTHKVRMLRIINGTDGDMIFTDDTTDAAGKWIVPAKSFVLYDYTSNSHPNEGCLAYPEGIVVSVKQYTAPTEGAVWVECTYVKGQ